MVMPKIEREAVARNYGKFVISPLERGYGDHAGQCPAARPAFVAGRRGRHLDPHHRCAARILRHPGRARGRPAGDAQHQTAAPDLHEGDTARLRLEVRGEGVVTAADIIDAGRGRDRQPGLYLFTVDDDKAHLEIEMNVQRGRGYSPVRRTRPPADRRAADRRHLQPGAARALRGRPGARRARTPTSTG